MSLGEGGGAVAQVGQSLPLVFLIEGAVPSTLIGSIAAVESAGQRSSATIISNAPSRTFRNRVQLSSRRRWVVHAFYLSSFGTLTMQRCCLPLLAFLYRDGRRGVSEVRGQLRY